MQVDIARTWSGCDPELAAATSIGGWEDLEAEVLVRVIPADFVNFAHVGQVVNVYLTLVVVAGGAA